MGLNQKQAVATLYVISAILGLSAVVLTTGGEQRAILLFAALCIAGAIAARLVFPQEIRAELDDWRERRHEEKPPQEPPPSLKPEPSANAAPSGKASPSPKRKRKKRKSARKR
jgi:UDP-GlcNAc:undecaprenyl-phosphate GlcNAc-1-phosphate transferase